MTNFTRFSLRNPIAIIILMLLLLVGGVFSSTQLNQEAMPDTSAPVVYVNVVYPGASAEEALNRVTAPLEKVIQNVEGVKGMTSTTADSLTFIRVEFDLKDDLDLKKSKVEEAVSSVALPPEVISARVDKNSAESNPIFYSALSPQAGVSDADFQNEVLNHILPEVRSLAGVGNIQTLGLNTTQVQINVNPEKLKEKQFSYQQVVTLLKGQNMSSALGEVTLDNKNEAVTLNGTLATMDEIANLLLRSEPALRLKDVATIEQAAASDTIASVNGTPAVAFNVMKTSDANTVKVSELVQEHLKKYESTVKLNIIYDTAKDIKHSISGLAREGGLGALFAALLILLFLRNFRATLISIISIPLSILTTLILMLQFDLPLNIMTLAGMVVATGRVVDDSIVVIENIMRRLHQERMSHELITDSVKEVAKAITSSTLTTIAVFAPLGMLSGSIGIVFGPFAVTVVICLLTSLFVSVTVVPMLSYVMMRKSAASHEEKESALARRYQKALKWSLNHKAVVLIVSVLLLIGSLPLAMVAGFSFMPDGEDKVIAMQLTLPRGTDLAKIESAARTIDEKLRQDPRVENAQLVAGSPKGQSKSAAVTNTATWMVTLDNNSDIDQFIKEKKDELKPSTADTTLDLYRIVNTAGGPDIKVTVNGPNRDVIQRAAEQITKEIQALEGTENVKNNLQEGIKGVQILVRHDDLIAKGLTSAQVSQMVRPYLSAQKVGTLQSGNLQEDVYIQLQPVNGLPNLEEISNLEIANAAGQLIKIKEVADVAEIDQPGSLQLLDGKEYASVTARITVADKSTVNTKMKEMLKGLSLPDGATYSLGGSNQQINEMMSDMGMAILIAIGAVYVVMVVTFGGGKAPFAILFSIPFALIGSLVATILAGQPLSLNSMIGFLMLIGIVVTNAIVLLDRVGQHMERGESVRESLLAAGGVRLRPILMTAIATMMAILPMVLGLGESMLMSQGLAVVVFGGLISSTFLTLFIVPVMFEILHRKHVAKSQTGTLQA